MSASQILVGIVLTLGLAVACQIIAARIRSPAIVLLLPVGFVAGALTTVINPDKLFGAAAGGGCGAGGLAGCPASPTGSECDGPHPTAESRRQHRGRGYLRPATATAHPARTASRLRSRGRRGGLSHHDRRASSGVWPGVRRAGLPEAEPGADAGPAAPRGAALIKVRNNSATQAVTGGDRCCRCQSDTRQSLVVPVLVASRWQDVAAVGPLELRACEGSWPGTG
jgi:hypothetical protein